MLKTPVREECKSTNQRKHLTKKASMLYVISSVMVKTDNCLKVHNFQPNGRGKQNEKKFIQNKAKKEKKEQRTSGANTVHLDDYFKTKHTKNYIQYKQNKESS